MPGPVSDSYKGPSDRRPLIPWRHFFTEFRSDGWPLCPRCGEDELWSPFMPQGPDYAPGTIDQYVAEGLVCYRCNYHFPGEAERHAAAARGE
jgi:hypothetical protein